MQAVAALREGLSAEDCGGPLVSEAFLWLLSACICGLGVHQSSRGTTDALLTASLLAISLLVLLVVHAVILLSNSLMIRPGAGVGVGLLALLSLSLPAVLHLTPRIVVARPFHVAALSEPASPGPADPDK